MKRAAVPSILVAVVLLALGVAAEAQQAKKVPRIGYLSSSDAASESNRFEASRLALRELGYLLKEAVPKVARVAVLYQSTIPSSVLELKDVLPVAARALGLTIQPWEVRTADGFEKVFVALNKERPDGLYVLGGGSLMLINRKRIAGLAIKSRLPSMYFTRESVDAGGLMSYGADRADNYRRVAYFIDRILKGAKPADLPVEQPTKFALVINLKTAKQIGLTIPPNVLVRADKVIK